MLSSAKRTEDADISVFVPWLLLLGSIRRRGCVLGGFFYFNNGDGRSSFGSGRVFFIDAQKLQDHLNLVFSADPPIQIPYMRFDGAGPYF